MNYEDKAIWMSWYDLPAEGRDAYLSWLHASYIPRMLKNPGFLWAGHYQSNKVPPAPRLTHVKDPSVPAGSDYILMFGGEGSHTFSRGSAFYMHPNADNPGRMHAGLSAEDRKMLALRKSERVGIMMDDARVEGPEAARREGRFTPGASIQLGNFIANSHAAEEELLSWYADWRMEALAKLPGCIGSRKLVSVLGWAKHGCMYEFVSEKSRLENYPTLRTRYPDATVWTERFTRNLIHAPGSPMIATRIWPPVRGAGTA